MVALEGVDAIAFTGGIGENSQWVRREVCKGLSQFGITLCEQKNQSGAKERRIDAGADQTGTSNGSTTQSIADTRGNVEIWIVPTNEELIVARQTVEALRLKN